MTDKKKSLKTKWNKNPIKLEFTKEELRKMKLIQNTDRTPRHGLTDPEWQVEFELRKKFIEPYPDHIKRLKPRRDEENTENGRYKNFINDVLHNIESSHLGSDYCYFIYQIEDLLKFHKDDLRTFYMADAQCFMVWLDESYFKKKEEEKKKK